MNDTYKVRSIGGALLVTLPQKFVRVVGLKAGDNVKIGLAGLGQGGIITVERAKPTKGKGK